MNSNLATGGLVLKADGKMLLSDIHQYSGTIMLDFVTGERTVIDSVMWFMNHDRKYVFYSDQKRGNAMYRFDLDLQTAELVMENPCYGLIYSDEWLYYVNENDRKLYRCLLSGKSEQRLTDEQVACFLVENERIYYAAQQGISTCNTSGSHRETVSDTAAVGMIMAGSQLAFADKGKQHALTLLDLTTGNARVFEHLTPISLNTDGRYLYCSNRKNDRTIYRMDLEQESSIRICGESADYLHMIEEQVFFAGRNEWLRMSLSGGQPVKATMLP